MLTFVERAEGAIGLADVAGFEQRVMRALPPSRRRQFDGEPADALRKHDHDQRQHGAEHEAPVLGQRLQLVLQQDVAQRADRSGPKKLEKPPSTAMNTSWPDCVQ